MDTYVHMLYPHYNTIYSIVRVQTFLKVRSASPQLFNLRRGRRRGGAVFGRWSNHDREAKDFSKKFGILTIEHFLHVCWLGRQWSRPFADFFENSTARRHARACTSSTAVVPY